MNILLLRQYNPYLESGASGNRFCGLVDGLCREGHRVTIGVVGGLQRENELSFKCEKPNLQIVYLSKANHYDGIKSRLNTYFFAGLHLLRAKNKLHHLLKHKYDIVWLTNNGDVLKLYKRCFNRFKRKSFIELNEFNDIYKEEKRGNFLQNRKAIRDSELLLESLAKIDLFAVMTKTLLNYYQGLAKPEARFLHLPMTVDISRFDGVSASVEYKKPYIAFTGTMTNHKDGVDVLIKSFAKIAGNYPTYHLYLAGFWHYDVPMQEKLIAEYGLQDRIHYIGTLKRDQIPPFVCNASILALSRPNSHQAQGGFPTKLGEYLATGNPVCVTKVGEIPDYLEDNVSAFMAKPGDVDSFADAMDRALRDAENSKLVGLKGKEVAEKVFNAEIQANRLSGFLKENVG